MPRGLMDMYWVKCKQTQSLTTLCSHFLLSYINQAMTKTAHWWSWSRDLHGYSEGRFFSRKYSWSLHIDPRKFTFFPYKQVSGSNGDPEWLRMTNAFILCDLVWKVQKSCATNREGNFKKGIICLSQLTSASTEFTRSWSAISWKCLFLKLFFVFICYLTVVHFI